MTADEGNVWNVPTSTGIKLWSTNTKSPSRDRLSTRKKANNISPQTHPSKTVEPIHVDCTKQSSSSVFDSRVTKCNNPGFDELGSVKSRSKRKGDENIEKDVTTTKRSSSGERISLR